MNSGSIQFDQKQVNYLMQKIGCEDGQEAVETFARIVSELGIDPFKMHAYLMRLMIMDGAI